MFGAVFLKLLSSFPFFFISICGKVSFAIFGNHLNDFVNKNSTLPYSVKFRLSL